MQKTLLIGVKLCAFDAYGTLFDLRSMFDGVREKLGATSEALAELWRRKQLEYSWLRSLMGRQSDFWHITGEALDHAMSVLGLNDPALRAKLMQAHLSPSLFPDVKAALASLRASGQTLTILSNGTPSMLTAAVSSSAVDVSMDALVSAEKAGTYKPHPSVYNLVVEKFNIPASEIAFISANAWDAAGAAAFGLRSVWLNRLGKPRETLSAAPESEIASLAELPGIIKP